MVEWQKDGTVAIMIMNNGENRQDPDWTEAMLTVFSEIINKMPRYIKARTETGFYLKVTLFIIAHIACKAVPIIG